MKQMLQKIVLLVAVVTVICHALLPHIHHDEFLSSHYQHHDLESQTASHDHHDDEQEENSHHFFSLVQLDENFIPSHGYVKYAELPVEYLPALAIACLRVTLSGITKIHYSWYQQHPPPEPISFFFPRRGPPAC